MAYRKGTHTRGLFLSAAALLTAASPAHAADQFKQTVDVPESSAAFQRES